jgi:cell division protein FtsW
MRDHYMQLESPVIRRRLLTPDFDVYLLIAVLMLCAVGFLMVWSASISPSYQATDDVSTSYFFTRHLRNFAIGAVVMVLFMLMDYRVWRRLSIWILLATIAALVAVLAVGQERFAAQRSLFSGSIQPGEMAKLAIVIYMAAWLSSWQKQLKRVTYGLIPFSILVGTTCSLIVVQPDLSTAASILATAMTMFFLAGAAWEQLGLVAAGAGALGYILITRLPYARGRIDEHLGAIRDLTKANDHVQASVEAFLNGQLFGVGLGQGTMKFGRLPFPHTDSIFAVIGEETGLVGTFIVLGLFVILIYRGFLVGRSAPDVFGGLLACGVCVWIAYDAMLNIAVMTALAPPTGVPLPFISFGGSSLVTAMAGMGLVLSVSRQAARAAQNPERNRQGTLLPPQEENRSQKENPVESAGIGGRHGRGNISRVSRRRHDSDDQS